MPNVVRNTCMSIHSPMDNSVEGYLFACILAEGTCCPFNEGKMLIFPGVLCFFHDQWARASFHSFYVTSFFMSYDIFLCIFGLCLFNSFLKVLFIFRERGREEGRVGEKHPWEREASVVCLSHTPIQGPSLQPRHVPCLGIEPKTLWLAVQHSTHWATPARVVYIIIYLASSLCNEKYCFNEQCHEYLNFYI